MEEQTGGSQLGLLDVLSNPHIAELVLGNISKPGAARLACKALRQQVDRQLKFLTTTIQHVDHVKLAKQLARKGIRPTTLILNWRDTHDAARNYGAALADGSLQPLIQDVTDAHLEPCVPLPSQVFAGLVSAMPNCKELSLYADGAQLAQLPLSQATQLQSLTLMGAHPTVVAQGSTPQVHDLSPIAGLTKLTCLGYMDEFCHGITALTTLTALTQLFILPPGPSAAQQYAKLTTQSALAAALPALPSLKQLSLSYVQPGPLTDTLPQLTSLTQLDVECLTGINTTAPLRLPSSLHVLELPWVDVSVLCGIITAPNLHHVTVSANVGRGQVAELKQLTEGLLQHCADLSLSMKQGTSEQDVVGLMTVLKSSWKPTDAARRADNFRFKQLLRSKGRPAWALTIWEAPCTQRVLQQVPPGITNLDLRSCTLQPDTLHPLARLASLRQLGIRGCVGVSMAALQHLLATAEQGCLLTVSVSTRNHETNTCMDSDRVTQGSLRTLHSLVAGQRGSRNTPALDWASY